MLWLQKLRAQENRLEKIQFKGKEAENITVNYQKVKRHLQVSPDMVYSNVADYPISEILPSFPSSFCFSLFLSLTSQLSPHQEESLTFQSILDSLEAEILKYREELSKMQIMNTEAQISKKAVKVNCWVFMFKVWGGRRPSRTYIGC